MLMNDMKWEYMNVPRRYSFEMEDCGKVSKIEMTGQHSGWSREKVKRHLNDFLSWFH